jgi:hypothetical protein
MAFMDRFAKYPITVMVFSKYGNTLEPTNDRGRYVKQRVQTADGFIENNYLHLKKEDVKIPLPNTQFYQSLLNKRRLFLLKLDRWTYYPMNFDADKITIYTPVYKMDEQGIPLKDENDQMILEGYTHKQIFDSRIVLDNGQVVQAPNLIAHKTYDKEHWLSNEIETAQRLYRSKDFWERYGNIISLAVVGILMMLFLYVGASNFTKMIETEGKNAEVIAQNLAQVATRCGMPGTTSPGTAGTPPPNP